MIKIAKVITTSLPSGICWAFANNHNARITDAVRAMRCEKSNMLILDVFFEGNNFSVPDFTCTLPICAGVPADYPFQDLVGREFGSDKRFEMELQNIFTAFTEGQTCLKDIIKPQVDTFRKDMILLQMNHQSESHQQRSWLQKFLHIR